MKKFLALILAFVMSLSIIGCSSSSDGDHIHTLQTPGSSNDSVIQTGDKGDTGVNNDIYIPQGREGEFLYAQPAVMWGDWIDGKQTFQGIYAVSLIFIGDTFEHFRPPVIDDFAIYINEERQSYTNQDLHIHVEKLSELPVELYGHIPNDEDLVSIYNYRFGHNHEYEFPDGPGTYWFEATVDGVKIRSNTFVINEDGTGGHLDDMPQPASPLKLTLKSPPGEFLYAQPIFNFIIENDIPKVNAINGVRFFFTAGYTYYSSLPPIVNDFVMYVNGVEHTKLLPSSHASGISLSNTYLDENPYVPRDEDYVATFTFEFRYVDEYREPGEYWFEATVEGVRIRSSTLIWHNDGSFEYLDDMPAPSSPVKLRSRSSILPAESISIDPNERGYNLGYPVAVDKNDWVYYLADRNLHRMRADGTGIETINIGFEVYAFNVIGDWIYTQLNVNWESGLYRFRTDGSDLTFIMDASDWGGGGTILIVGEWLYYSAYGIGFNRVRTADGSEHTKINEDDIWVTQIGNEWFYYLPNTFPSVNKIIRGSTDGSGEDDIVFSQFDTIGQLQLVGDWLYFIGTNQQIYSSLYKYHVDTKELVQIINEDCQKYIVSGDWVYYTLGWSAGEEGFYVLRRIRTDGTGDTQIGRETGTFNFNVAGDWIFFYEAVENEGEIIYRMRTDGSGDIIRVGRYH